MSTYYETSLQGIFQRTVVRGIARPTKQWDGNKASETAPTPTATRSLYDDVTWARGRALLEDVNTQR